jgi:hypothetical protein
MAEGKSMNALNRQKHYCSDKRNGDQKENCLTKLENCSVIHLDTGSAEFILKPGTHGVAIGPKTTPRVLQVGPIAIALDVDEGNGIHGSGSSGERSGVLCPEVEHEAVVDFD